MKRIKVPNNIFTYQLSKSAFRVYIYLHATFEAHNLKGKARFSKIASKCNISLNTAQKAVNELISKKLVIKHNTYKHCNRKKLLTSNHYTIIPISGGYGLANKNICDNIIDNSAFMIYCYIIVRANNSGYSFPKYNLISEETGLSRSTVINKISYLNNLLFLRKKRRWRIDGRSLSNEHWVSVYFDIFKKPRISIKINSKVRKMLKLFNSTCKMIAPIFQRNSLKNAYQNIKLVYNNLFSLKTKILR